MRRTSASPTLRVAATAAATVVFALVLAGSAVLLVTTLEDRLGEASDDLARARAADLLDLAARGALPRRLPTVGDEGAAQVIGADGTVLAASGNLTGRPAIPVPDPGDAYRTRVLEAPDDAETETYRAVVAAGPSPRGRVTVVVGSSLEAVSEASSALRRTLWGGVPLVVLLLGAVTWLVLGRVLGRLDRIRAEVDAIGDEGLHRRVADDGAADEVGRLAATMNAMLDRLEGAARRQQHFVADVSHDLQSPLAAQRVSLELALQDPRTVDARRLRDEVLTATDQMERLVGDLLVMAAADHEPSGPAPLVDLDELVLEEAARARVGTEVVIDAGDVSAAPARAHPDDVRRVVRNLLDNALTHASGRVRLLVTSTTDGAGGTARLDVVDDGPGVPPEHREHVFDRFHRVDGVRPRGRGGSGLGLAIASRLAERSAGRLVLLDSAEGAHFRLTLPGPGEHGTGA